jgi:predicted acyl esterase
MTKSLVLIALFFTSIACSSASSSEIKITEKWITLEDGVRLAADIYWPAGADTDDRFPVLLEYLPYRKDESRARNYSLYSYFLDHGYVVARVDMRGTGRSEGRTIPYEYSDIELDDGEEVIGHRLAGKPGMVNW